MEHSVGSISTEERLIARKHSGLTDCLAVLIESHKICACLLPSEGIIPNFALVAQPASLDCIYVINCIDIQMPLPTFLIVGAPRCGTTWLANNLREHPQIFMPQEKELHFFDRHYDRGLQFYEDSFEDAEHFEVIGEATPDYLYVPSIPERIHAHMPDCKMILCLRNPIDRVYSRYWNAKAKFPENRSLSFEDKIRMKPLFLEEGKYYTHLKRYYQYFSPDQFLILLFEEIQTTPDQLLDKVFRFLEVEPNYRPSRIDERINAAASKPYLAKSRFIYYFHKIARRLGLRKLSRLLETRNMAELPPMKSETRQWLQDIVYRDENLRLQQLTGIDVSSWR